MADKWADLFGESSAPAPEKTGIGPAARRARAGMPPGPSTDDPDPSGPAYTTVRQLSGEGQPGRLPLPPPTPEGVPSGVPDPTKFRVGEGARAQTELEGDPMAQGFVAGAMTAPLGAGVLGAAGKIGGPLARVGAVVPVGAAQGAAAAKMQGADAREGAAFGALFALGPALEGIGQVMSQPNRDLGIVQDLAPHMTPEARQTARQVGYARVADASRKFGVVGAPNPDQAHAAVKSGVSAIGQEIGDVYATVGNEYARPTGGFMSNVTRDTQSMRGTRSGNAIADAIDAEAKRIQDINGGSASSTMPLRTIRKELTDSQAAGYGGKKFEQLTDSEQAMVGRAIARHLQTELDAGLAQAAKDPRFASQVGRIPDLNATYRALLVLDETTGRMVDRSMRTRPPTGRERYNDAVNAATAGTLGKPLPASAQPVRMPTGTRLGGMGGDAAAPSAGFAGALAKKEKDPTALDAEMRSIFLGAVGAQ